MWLTFSDQEESQEGSPAARSERQALAPLPMDLVGRAEVLAGTALELAKELVDTVGAVGMTIDFELRAGDVLVTWYWEPVWAQWQVLVMRPDTDMEGGLMIQGLDMLAQDLREHGVNVEDLAGEARWHQFRQRTPAPPRRAPIPGEVYFIEAVGTGLVKIGWSRDARVRIGQLQTVSPVELRFLGSRPGTFDDERALHQKYRAVRAQGEWFQLTDEIREKIDETANA